MSFTINADDPRSIKAIQIAGEAGQWMKCIDRATGETFFGVPSQRNPGVYYRVTLTACDCEDFKRNGLSECRVGMAGEHGLCKHILAVRLHEELRTAVDDRTRGGQRRHLHLVPKQATAELASRHPDVFDRFEGD